MARAKNKDKKQLSAQNSIPYVQMYPDGICHVEKDFYSKTMMFQDINYQISQQEDQETIMRLWRNFLNYFDSDINFQFSFLNTTINEAEFTQSISIPDQGDDFDDIRREYTEMLQNQLACGTNGLMQQKYITFGIHGDSIKTVKPRLEHIESNLWSAFKKMGVQACGLNGKERLKLMRDILQIDGSQQFDFDWKMLPISGLSTKDFIAPTSFTFDSQTGFRTGRTYGAVSFLRIEAPELSDRVLADFMDVESNQLITMHLQPIDPGAAIKMIKRTLTDIDAMKITEQKKAVRSGYDMDIMPTDLHTYGPAAKQTLEKLQSHNERLFLLTVTIVHGAKTQKALSNVISQVKGIGNQHNCPLARLDCQQEQGFFSALPLAHNTIAIQRQATTKDVAIFMPFTTQELFQSKGMPLYYGLNALSKNIIMIDRKQLKTPNGLILGKPGSGKSFAAKREIANVFFATDDDVIICDPESEYFPLVKRLDGQVIKISPTSPHHINPMDINLNYSDEDNPLALKSDFIISLCELIVGGKEGLSPVDISIIDRCVNQIYTPYLADPNPEKMPILQDLYDALSQQEEKEATRIRSSLEIYIKGSLNVFNHRTNVDIDNRVVCFDIKELGKQLKKLGMLVVQDQVWNRVTVNRAEKRSTRYYIDEFHLLLKEEQTAAYSVEIWKRFRKWGGIPTGITQNVNDLLASREISNIFGNSDFVYLLNQAPEDRMILAKQLHISPEQLSYVTDSGTGEGLLVYGSVILPFVDKFPQDTELYRLMTTKLEEVGG